MGRIRGRVSLLSKLGVFLEGLLLHLLVRGYLILLCLFDRALLAYTISLFLEEGE